MINMEKFLKIRALADDGLNHSEIASELKINRKTVSRYLQKNSPPSYQRPRAGRTRKDHFTPYCPRAKELLENPNMTNVEIFELIKEEGYLGSERTVQRRLREIKGEAPKERFFEQSYEAGEQSQFDFKESVMINFHGGARIVHFVFGTLPYSGRFFIKAFPRKNFECFIEGMHSFFESVGGVTKNIRIDNLSPCVSRVHKGSRRTYTMSFERSINYYGFGVLPCSPGKGNEKGDVERDIQTHVRRMKNLVDNQRMVFLDFSELNSWIESYVEKRITDEIKSSFKEEQKSLRPLAPRDEGVLCRVEESTPNGFGVIRVGDYSYSVADSVIKEKCVVVAGPYDIKIYRKSPRVLVARHTRLDGDSILIEHVLPSLVRKPQAMIRWAHKDILFLNSTYERYYQKLVHLGQGAQKAFLQSVNLVQHVSVADITSAMELMLSENVVECVYETLRDLLLTERRPNKVIDISYQLEQKKLTPNLKEFDELIPKGG